MWNAHGFLALETRRCGRLEKFPTDFNQKGGLILVDLRPRNLI